MYDKFNVSIISESHKKKQEAIQIELNCCMKLKLKKTQNIERGEWKLCIIAYWPFLL